MLVGLSPDGRWLLVGNFSNNELGEIGFQNIALQVHELPGGEQVLRRNVHMGDAQHAHHVARTQPILLFSSDISTVELWHLERRECLARWKPLGNRPLIRLGFAGDTLFFGVKDTPIELLPLAELQAQLNELGLGW